jgi:uncharacterized membrane protein YfcA
MNSFLKNQMSITSILLLALIGLLAGIISGFVGIGGGMIMVPAMIYFFQYNQFQAQGTSLAVLMMPVGIFAVVNYYQAGHIQFIPVFAIALGFVVGAFLGSKWVLGMDIQKVKLVFGLFMFLMSAKISWDAYQKITSPPAPSETKKEV